MQKIYAFTMDQSLRYRNEVSAVIAGSFGIATSINLCLGPHNLAFGGITGLSILLEQFGFPLSLSYILISIILLLLGGIYQGRSFFVKSLSTVITIPSLIMCTNDLQALSPYLHPIVAAIVGAVLLGSGVGVILAVGGSSVGPDTIAAVCSKRIPEHITMYTIDGCIILAGFLVFGPHNAYSLITYAMVPYIVRMVKQSRWVKNLIYHPVSRERICFAISYGKNKWEFFV
ncbi:MAG: YitT family protein [Chitinispirillales bacterium]|jgi:uncharacterized membrane-anchored protein YitT (DUF2179 family)|nr:YitT family protein [Chitinispirillales bacterium]